MAQNSNKTIKKTNSKQFEKIVELMQQHQDVAKGLGRFGSNKKSRAGMWREFSAELNSLGPPARDGPGWNKVWLDFKLKLKKKLARNRRESTAAGGGLYSKLKLSPLEQAVDSLLGMNSATVPEGPIFDSSTSTSDFSTSTSTIGPCNNSIGTNINMIVPEDDDPIFERICGQRKTEAISRKRKRASVSNTETRENEHVELLKQQIANQEALIAEVRMIEENLRDIAVCARETLELSKKKEARKEREHYDRMQMHRKKMELKMKQLELKELKCKS